MFRLGKPEEVNQSNFVVLLSELASGCTVNLQTGVKSTVNIVIISSVL